MATPVLEPGDIVLVHGRALFSRLIRVFTRSKGESPTIVNHVGIMVTSENIVESLSTTVQRKFWQVYPRNNQVYVVRKLYLTPAGRQIIVEKALEYLGAKYGWLKIVAHAVDHFVFRDMYVVRRLAFMDNYPICSWVVAYAYFKAGYSFGVYPNAATPDDIFDFVVEKHPEEWTVVYKGG